MKKFNDVSSAMKWVSKVVSEGTEKATEMVAEQVYKDSNEFTYRESGEMYQSGEVHSDFKKGVIIERTPYVRRRYYEGGKAGAGNLQAQPRWFEKTVTKYNKEYKTIITSAINQAKKG